MERLVVVACLFGATGVLFGAFGAHGLEAMIAESGGSATRMDWWQTGAHYHLIHALAVAFAGWRARSDGRAAIIAGALFSAGILLFSGSLYAMALGAPSTLGMVTPLGGLCFVFGWTAAGFGALRDGSTKPKANHGTTTRKREEPLPASDP